MLYSCSTRTLLIIRELRQAVIFPPLKDMPNFGPNAVKDMRAYVSHGMHHRCPHTTAYVSPSTTCVLILHVHRRCPSTSAHVLIPLTTCVLILLNAPQLSAYSHGMHHICVRILLCVCHTPLHMCRHTNKCTCPHITICTCPHTPMCPDSTISLRILLNAPGIIVYYYASSYHNTTYVSLYYSHHSFPHTATYVSSYHYMCPHTTLHPSVL